jgi:hypothetical protein
MLVKIDSKDVTKKGTIPKIKRLSFSWCPFCVSNVNRKINPVSVKYLHFVIKVVIVLKNGIIAK